MALPAIEDFSGMTNYAELGADANWTTNSTGIYHLSGYIYAGAAGSTWGATHWSADTFTDAQYSKIEITSISNFRYMGVTVFNDTSANSWYGYAGDNTTSLIVEMVAGTPSTLSGGLSILNTTDVIKLTTSVSAGTTTLTAYINDVLEASTTDTSFTSGYAGVCCYANNAASRADNWEGGDITAGGGFKAVWAYNSNQTIGVS